VLTLFPVSIRLAAVEGKPVDFVGSDFLLVLLPLLYLLSPHTWRLSISRDSFPVWRSSILLFVFVTTISIIGAVTSGGLTQVISSMKFSKGIVLLTLLTILQPRGGWPEYFVRSYFKVLIALIWILMISTCFLPNFPICRWGGSFFGLEVYGFPNSYMTFLAMHSPFLLVALVMKQSNLSRYFIMLTGLILISMVAMSLSRSSIIVLAVSVSVCILFAVRYSEVSTNFRAISLLGSFLSIPVAVILLYPELLLGIDYEGVFEVLQRRISKTTRDVDPFSGRKYLWLHCWDLILERPFFGYMFEPFSNFNDSHDTPHQQYLEILFKCGSAGFILFSIVYLSLVRQLLGRMRGYSPELRLACLAFLAGFVGILVGNFTQPNFTFAITGNSIAVFYGILAFQRQALTR